MKISANLTFLILDDDQRMRIILKEVLWKNGFNGPFFESDDVEFAKIILENQKISGGKAIDIILCDWEMPKGTGLEFVKWIRKEADYINTPFLMITSVNQQEKVLDALNSGVTNYLLKPFSSNEFIKKLKNIIKQHQDI